MQACDPATYYLQQVSRATSMKTLDDNGCVTSCGIENGFSPATNVYGCSGCVRTCKTGQNCFLVKKVSVYQYWVGTKRISKVTHRSYILVQNVCFDSRECSIGN